MRKKRPLSSNPEALFNPSVLTREVVKNRSKLPPDFLRTLLPFGYVDSKITDPNRRKNIIKKLLSYGLTSRKLKLLEPNALEELIELGFEEDELKQLGYTSKEIKEKSNDPVVKRKKLLTTMAIFGDRTEMVNLLTFNLAVFMRRELSNRAALGEVARGLVERYYSDKVNKDIYGRAIVNAFLYNGFGVTRTINELLRAGMHPEALIKILDELKLLDKKQIARIFVMRGMSNKEISSFFANLKK